MAKCTICTQDMLVAKGCDPERTIEFYDGSEMEPVPYSEDDQDAGPCHDCGAFPGEYHHPGCDMERCPSCGGQYFICDCTTHEKRTMWSDA